MVEEETVAEEEIVAKKEDPQDQQDQLEFTSPSSPPPSPPPPPPSAPVPRASLLIPGVDETQYENGDHTDDQDQDHSTANVAIDVACCLSEMVGPHKALDAVQGSIAGVLLVNALSNGNILCQIVIKYVTNMPAETSALYTSNAVLGTADAANNVMLFLNTCRDILGIDQMELFLPEHLELEDEGNVDEATEIVVMSILHFAAVLHAKYGTPLPNCLLNLEEEKTEEEFTQESPTPVQLPSPVQPPSPAQPPAQPPPPPPPPLPPQTSSTAVFQIGDRVHALYYDDNQWYGAKIVGVLPANVAMPDDKVQYKVLYEGYGDEVAVTDQVLAWDDEWMQDTVEQEEDEVVPRQEDVVQKKKVMADLLHKLSSKQVGGKVEQKRTTNHNSLLMQRPRIPKGRRGKTPSRKKTKIDTTETF